MKMMNALLVSLTILASSTAVAKAKVAIVWDYKDMAPDMKIYDYKGTKAPALWKTEIVKEEKDLPIGAEIPASTLELAPGKSKRFVLVYRNKTDKPVHFFAAPHSASPPENSLGFKFKCLCINHAFKVEPKSSWYRIVDFKLSEAFSGEKLEIKHILVGLAGDKAEQFNKAAKDAAIAPHDM